MAQYPIGIFKKGFIWFFTFIIPYGFINYYPLLYIIERTYNKLYMFLPIFSIFFIIPCYIVWNIGLRKYKSTGS